MLGRLLAVASLLVLVLALGTNSQYFDPEFYLDGDVLSLMTPADDHLVAKVVDGDTIKLANGQTVRYIGIDTPETVDPRTETQCYARQASNFNEQLVKDQVVRLEKDVSETDRYGRLLRYVYVDFNGQEIMVNKYLVEKGFAVVDTHPPDLKYAELFKQAEEVAMMTDLGLWGECN